MARYRSSGQRFLTQRQLLVDVKYFTAKVQDTPEKPGQRARQEKYLRALATLPKVTIYYGHFQTRTAIRLLEHPPKNRRPGDIGLRSVWLQEEKGSDVNLATQLIADGLRARYDLAIVVSNDGDLKNAGGTGPGKAESRWDHQPARESQAKLCPFASRPSNRLFLPLPQEEASSELAATCAPERRGRGHLLSPGLDAETSFQKWQEPPKGRLCAQATGKPAT